MKMVQRGFTLIELMIVVAIVGILAAIALPAYQDYLARSRTTEPLARLAQAKTSIAEFYASRNTMPADTALAGIDTSSTQYISTASWDPTSSRVVVTISSGIPQLSGEAIYMDATNVDATSYTIVSWQCGLVSGTTAKYKYLPANCRNS